MMEVVTKTAEQSINPIFFIFGMIFIYFTSIVLILAVGVKFFEHFKNPQELNHKKKHPFSTLEMTICVLLHFPFWLNSIGQIPMDNILQNIYFYLGSFMIVVSLVWHIWAKLNIRYMWSDGIEIKKEHQLINFGAFSYARHPMYASLLMWCFGCGLLMFNYITLLFTTLVFLPLMISRAKDEEKELVKMNKDYLLYKLNVHMITPTIGGRTALLLKLLALILFVFCIFIGITLPSVLLLFFVHLYLGYTLNPENVAFSYRSKSTMMLAIFALSQVWYPFYYMFYVVLAMFVYGLKWNCPCMIVYNKYHRCPCFDMLEKCIYKTKKPLE